MFFPSEGGPMSVRALMKESLTDEYFERVDERMRKAASLGRRIAPIVQIANLAENHLARYAMARQRYQRSIINRDKMSQGFERALMYVLLYEALDHICMALNLLDFEALDLESSLDGHGLAGDCSPEIVQLLGSLNEKATRMEALQKEGNIRLDFSEPLDEKEGITYNTFPHWQDFSPGSVQKSFRDYFKSVRLTIHRRLDQKPLFWKTQNVRQYLHRKGHDALLHIIGQLEGARL